MLIVGMGRSGVSAALAARRMLPATGVILSDSEAVVLHSQDETRLREAGVRVEPGRSDHHLLDGCGLVIKSPGVPGEIPLLEAARNRGIPVWGEVEFAWRFLPNRFVGITGTNGKTTTVELTGHILRSAGLSCRVAGNVGTALSSLVGKIAPEEILVVELSSFQLEDSVSLRPDIAVLLNLSEDHLDRHAGAAQYFSAKRRIFVNQLPGDVAVVNLDDENLSGASLPGEAGRVWFSRRSQGKPRPGAVPLVFVRDGVIFADLEGLGQLTDPGRNRPSGGEVSSTDSRGGPVPVLEWSQASLKGDHNLENSLAATAVALLLGLAPEDVAAGLKSFSGVRHRLQEVRVAGGVRYVNDSKATNEDAAIKALTAFDGGIHLILGGSFKGCSFDRLAEAASSGKVREVILIGEAAAQIAACFARRGRSTIMAERLDEAVKEAAAKAAPGDVVLLAPACASYDQYNNYEERGEHFISLVKGLDGPKTTRGSTGSKEEEKGFGRPHQEGGGHF